MREKNLHFSNDDSSGSRFASVPKNFYGQGYEDFEGFSNKSDMRFDSMQRYWENCKVMMMSSFSHLKSPITLIVIILLIGTYILLGVAGNIGFSFYNNKAVQYITTNLDIIVNAVLGFFYGPVTCAIGVGMCTVVRMITNANAFYIGYFIAAVVAGFLHGWILYRLKSMWFGTRFRRPSAELFSKVFTTRLIVSIFVNILLLALMHKLFYGSSIYEFILNYAKSDVPLTSFYEFLGVFIVSLAVETLIIFVALTSINFIVMKAFPAQFEQPSLIIGKDGSIINIEDEMMNDEMM